MFLAEMGMGKWLVGNSEFCSREGIGYLWKRMLSRFTVMMCASKAVVVGGQTILSGKPRDIQHCFFHHSFHFLGAKCCNFLRLQ